MSRTSVVLIHGLGCSREDWSAQVEYLAELADVTAPDLPGHGRTFVAGQNSIDAMAMFVNTGRPGPSQARTVLVGHSMGCRVALEAARREPDGLVGLVLIEGSQRAAGSAQDAGRRDDQALTGGRAALLQGFLDMFSDATPEAFRELALRRMEAMDAGVIARSVVEMTRWDAEDAVDALRCVRVPVLVIQSTFKSPSERRRPIEPNEMSPWLRLVIEHVSSAEIVWLTGLGHFPQVEAPRTINTLLGEFISRFK